MICRTVLNIMVLYTPNLFFKFLEVHYAFVLYVFVLYTTVNCTAVHYTVLFPALFSSSLMSCRPFFFIYCCAVLHYKDVLHTTVL